MPPFTVWSDRRRNLLHLQLRNHFAEEDVHAAQDQARAQRGRIGVGTF